MAGLSSSDQFQKVLDVAERQLKSNKISVRFGPTGKMRFIIDEVSLKDSLVASGVEESTFRQVFNGEIGPLLDAIIRNRLEEYVRNTPQFGPQASEDQKVQQATEAQLRDRARLVEKTLATPQLRGRHSIKASSKHPRLRFCLWEVVRKLEASATPPYATFSIETIRPEVDLGVWGSFPFFPTESIGRSETCSFDCDEEDLDDLILTLQEAKAALKRAAKGIANA